MKSIKKFPDLNTIIDIRISLDANREEANSPALPQNAVLAVPYCRLETGVSDDLHHDLLRSGI